MIVYHQSLHLMDRFRIAISSPKFNVKGEGGRAAAPMKPDTSILWSKWEVGSLELNGLGTVISGTGGIVRALAHDLGE